MQQPDLFPSIRRKTYQTQKPVLYTPNEISFMFINRDQDVGLYHQMFANIRLYQKQYLQLYEPGFMGTEDQWISTTKGLESFYRENMKFFYPSGEDTIEEIIQYDAPEENGPNPPDFASVEPSDEDLYRKMFHSIEYLKQYIDQIRAQRPTAIILRLAYPIEHCSVWTTLFIHDRIQRLINVVEGDSEIKVDRIVKFIQKGIRNVLVIYPNECLSEPGCLGEQVQKDHEILSNLHVNVEYYSLCPFVVRSPTSSICPSIRSLIHLGQYEELEYRRKSGGRDFPYTFKEQPVDKQAYIGEIITQNKKE